MKKFIEITNKLFEEISSGDDSDDNIILRPSGKKYDLDTIVTTFIVFDFDEFTNELISTAMISEDIISELYNFTQNTLERTNGFAYGEMIYFPSWKNLNKYLKYLEFFTKSKKINGLVDPEDYVSYNKQ